MDNNQSFKEAVRNNEKVHGYSHDFYNYPARFSPTLAEEAISLFTKEDDLILDPLGGGTTMVEALRMGRSAVGFDISTLAHFLTEVKTTPLSAKSLQDIKATLNEIQNKVRVNISHARPQSWIDAGYLRNLSGHNVWRIRKVLEQLTLYLGECRIPIRNKNFIRCALLKTGQWALDSRKATPSVAQFRRKLTDTITSMCNGISDLREEISSNNSVRTFNRSAHDVHKSKILQSKPPHLVLTSPPYPGVHIMYHRWQIHGRRETPAPFWIADCLDGHGLSHYIMGNRHQKGLETYFSNIQQTFASVAKICSLSTIVVQVLAFSKPSWQLPKYLQAMDKAGFRSVDTELNQLWRRVPNRKWHANLQGETNSSNEVILIHELQR